MKESLRHEYVESKFFDVEGDCFIYEPKIPEDMFQGDLELKRTLVIKRILEYNKDLSISINKSRIFTEQAKYLDNVKGDVPEFQSYFNLMMMTVNLLLKVNTFRRYTKRTSSLEHLRELIYASSACELNYLFNGNKVRNFKEEYYKNRKLHHRLAVCCNIILKNYDKIISDINTFIDSKRKCD